MKKETRICSVTGCDSKHYGLGYCRKHHSKFKLYGDPLAKRHNSPGQGHITKDGHRVFRVNGKKAYEHRMVMERILGRPLATREIIHHIDGNPLNNSPENLKIVFSNIEHRKEHARGFKRPCLVCGTPEHVKELCFKHYYEKWRRTMGIPPRKKNICKIEGCERFVEGFGLCVKHYCQMKKLNKKMEHNHGLVG